jgi:hypothetical protein
MKKLTRQLNESEVLFIDCLDQKSLEVINGLFGTHYSKSEVHKTIRVERAEKEPGFWDKFMRQKTGVQM